MDEISSFSIARIVESFFFFFVSNITGHFHNSD